MKKVLALLVVLGCVSTALFAQIELSAGLGGNFTADFATFAFTSDGKDFLKEFNQGPEDYNSHVIGGGFYVFFDATYAEANVGLLFGRDAGDKHPDDFYSDVTALKLSLFGKFPINLGAFTLFPMLGIDGQIFLGGKMTMSYEGEKTSRDYQDMDGDSQKEFKESINQLWFKLGVGADIPLTDHLYLRPEFLYGIRFNTKYEKDTLDNDEGDKMFNAIVGHGLDVRVALGWKF